MSNLWRNKEGNVLFNDTLNTFYVRLYGVRHMVEDDSDSERGNTLLVHSPLKEGSVLLNDELNTFYLRLYGVRHMVKDHSGSEEWGKNIILNNIRFKCLYTTQAWFQ